jgi:hypothetical protein
MSRAGPGGAASAATAMRRLDRAGHLPAALDGSAPLTGLTGEPLRSLAAEGSDVIARSGIAEVLAQLAAPPTEQPAVERLTGAVRRGAVPPASGSTVSPGAVVPRRARTLRPRQDALAGEPASRLHVTAGSWSLGLGAVLESELVAPGGHRIGHTAVISAAARLGAVTPFGRPIAASGAGVEPALASPPGSRTAESRVEWASEPPHASDPSARTRSAAPAGQLTQGRRDGLLEAAQSSGRPATHLQRFESETPGRGELPTGSSHTVTGGLAGLVSWWNSQSPTPVPDVSAANGSPPARRTAAWSVAGQRAPAVARQEAACFEGSLAARQALRSALEDVLLAEARASGIEVVP